MRTILFALTFALILPAPVRADSFSDVGEITAKVEPSRAGPGQTVKLTITVKPTKSGWHTYPTSSGKVVVKPPPIDAPQKRLLYVVGEVKDPDGQELYGDELVYNKAATWTVDAIVAPDAKPGAQAVTFEGFAIQICKTACINARPSDFPNVTLDVTDEKLRAVDEKYAADLKLLMQGTGPPRKVAPAAGIAKKNHLPVEAYKTKLNGLVASSDSQKVEREGGLLALLLTAAFWGFVSLVTPCVFPMIPITVSLFLKQSNQSTAGAVKLAGIYCGTIIAVLGLSAYSMLSLFRALSLNPWMNILLGALFIVFALSLLGMYNLTLPNFLLRAAESRRKRGGALGTVFAAIAFSIVSFTCVAPFLGGFAGMAASSAYGDFELILAALTYAGAFASPFFVLALFPSLLKKLPKSGGWMDTIKAVMGFFEVAAALKFFRTAEIRLSAFPTYFTYDLVLAGWVVVAFATGMYLLGFFRLPHDEDKSNLGVPRLMFAMLFLGAGLYLIPGLFKTAEGQAQRPRGVAFAWVDAFLLPEPTSGSGEFPWSSDLPDALDKARVEKRLVFVDFTGVICTNCKANEHGIFPKYRKLLEQYELVQLYTDDVPAEFFHSPPSTPERTAEGTANLEFQLKKFETQELPYYVILEPTATGYRIVNRLKGIIEREKDFEEFLSQPLAK